MTYAISLAYSCGCREEWTISQPPEPDDVTHHSPEPCVPEHCSTCEAAGRMCPTREGMRIYKPTEFTEIVPVKRTVRRKAS